MRGAVGGAGGRTAGTGTGAWSFLPGGFASWFLGFFVPLSGFGSTFCSGLRLDLLLDFLLDLLLGLLLGLLALLGLRGVLLGPLGLLGSVLCPRRLLARLDGAGRRASALSRVTVLTGGGVDSGGVTSTTVAVGGATGGVSGAASSTGVGFLVGRGVEGAGVDVAPVPDATGRRRCGRDRGSDLAADEGPPIPAPVTLSRVGCRIVPGGRCATTPGAGPSGLTTGGAETIVAGPRGSCTAMPTARIPAAVAERGKTAAASCRSNNGIDRIVTAAGDVPRP